MQESLEGELEEQVATLALDEVSLPRSPKATEAETQFNSNEDPSEVVHSLTGNHVPKHSSKSVKHTCSVLMIYSIEDLPNDSCNIPAIS